MKDNAAELCKTTSLEAGFSFPTAWYFVIIGGEAANPSMPNKVSRCKAVSAIKAMLRALNANKAKAALRPIALPLMTRHSLSVKSASIVWPANCVSMPPADYRFAKCRGFEGNIVRNGN
jgi:hypothetical protein